MAATEPMRRWLVVTPAHLPETILDEFEAEWHTEAIRCLVEGKIRGIYPSDSILQEVLDRSAFPAPRAKGQTTPILTSHSRYRTGTRWG